MSDKEKKVTAYHEAGHALVAHALPNTDPVHKITILPRGRALGYTMVLPTEDKYSQTRAELLDMLAYAMGGRAAEELVFHDPTTGASNDIEKATATARAMVTQYGMSERLGAVKFGQESGEVFMGRDMGHGRDYSEEVAAVRSTPRCARSSRTPTTRRGRSSSSTATSSTRWSCKLLDKETLNKDEVLEIFAPVVKRPAREHPTGNGRRPLSTSPPVLTPAELAVMGPADLAELEDLARGRKRDGSKATSRRRAPSTDSAPARSRASVDRTASPRKATGTARAASEQKPPATRRRAPRRATGTDPAS